LKVVKECAFTQVCPIQGKTAAVINDVKPAQQIVDEMVEEAVQSLQAAASFVKSSKPKL